MMLSRKRMLGPLGVMTTREDRFASIWPSMHRGAVNHSPESPARSGSRLLSNPENSCTCDTRAMVS